MFERKTEKVLCFCRLVCVCVGGGGGEWGIHCKEPSFMFHSEQCGSHNVGRIFIRNPLSMGGSVFLHYNFVKYDMLNFIPIVLYTFCNY